MKKLLISILAVLITFSLAAQNDTIFFMKNGQVVNKQSVKQSDVDSVIFYRPAQSHPVINISYVDIPAGTFTMGSPATEAERNIDETQHQVSLSAFKMSKYEITNAQFAAFLNTKVIGSDGKYTSGAYPTETLIHQSGNSWALQHLGRQWVAMPGYENHPVTVTWHGATEFATYIGAKLPTEAQWEYACRAGSTTPFNTGNCLSSPQANYDWRQPYIDWNESCSITITTYPGKTQAVGSYPANAWGLHDMHGNVWEWCSDWLFGYPTTHETDPTGSETGSERVIRGGSWSDRAQSCRSADRGTTVPGSRYSGNVGFRVVLFP
ncbi:MAG: formylglycine-generating enzyme family protein [Paludibacter sp.]|jgi:formylglycine-generating enzyme required for sulfatase activity|nr:formylglycine-generating enzyme family protein [Paludibacter sp.]